MKSFRRFMNTFIVRPLLRANPLFVVLYIVFFSFSTPLAVYLVLTETEFVGASFAVILLTVLVSAMTTIYFDFFNVYCLEPAANNKKEMGQYR